MLAASLFSRRAAGETIRAGHTLRLRYDYELLFRHFELYCRALAAVAILAY